MMTFVNVDPIELCRPTLSLFTTAWTMLCHTEQTRGVDCWLGHSFLFSFAFDVGSKRKRRNSSFALPPNFPNFLSMSI